MRFVDFLRAAVLLCAGSATALAAVTVVSAGGSDGGDVVVLVIAGWWFVAVLVGAWLGRQAQTNSPIARLLASAKSTASLPEQRPGALQLNRAWRRLVGAGTAIVVRDGGAFYVEPTGPLKPIKLIRAPGFRRDLVSANGTIR